MELSQQSWQEMKAALREVLEEEFDMGNYQIAQKWKGGKMVLMPFDPNLQSKEISIDVVFKKITSVREKLRLLEQKINNNDKLSLEEKAEYQGLITRAYGSLTTFNLLFRDEKDRFIGQKKDD